MINIAVLISGGGSNMVALLDRMVGNDTGSAALVLSNNPLAGGLDKAAERSVPTAIVDHSEFENRAAFEDAIQEILVAHEIHLICLAGFMRILTAEFVSKWQGRILNIHPSLLPKYKGLNTHARALAAGDTEAGCTVHLVTSDLDDGPILGQRAVPILAEDTVESLSKRVLEQEHELYPQVLKDFLTGLSK